MTSIPDSTGTHSFGLVADSHPCTKDDDPRQSPLSGDASEKGHCTPLREAPKDDAVRRNACVNFCADELIQRMHGLEHYWLILDVQAAMLKDVEPVSISSYNLSE